MPGVHAVWTAADVSHIPPIPFRLTGLKTLDPYRQPVLAKEVVRYVGEPVAVVFAENAYLAEDAADLVEVSTEQVSITLLATEQPGVYEHDGGQPKPQACCEAHQELLRRAFYREHQQINVLMLLHRAYPPTQGDTIHNRHLPVRYHDIAGI